MSLPCSWPSKSFPSHLGWTPELSAGPQCPSWRALVTSWPSFSSPLPLLLPLQPFRTSRCSSNPTATQSHGSAFPASVALDRARFVVIVVTLYPLPTLFPSWSLLLCEVALCTSHPFTVHHLELMRAGLHLAHSCRLSLKTVTGTPCHCVKL